MYVKEMFHVLFLLLIAQPNFQCVCKMCDALLVVKKTKKNNINKVLFFLYYARHWSNVYCPM